MSKPLLDFTSSLNWNLAFKQHLVAEAGSEANTYIPIPTRTFTCQSNLVLVGCRNPSARTSWKLGCWVTANLQIGLVDSATSFPGTTEIARRFCRLGQFTLLQWEAFDPVPYLIRLDIPWWHQELYVEAYWYDDIITDTTEQSLAAIQTSLSTIQSQLAS